MVAEQSQGANRQATGLWAAAQEGVNAQAQDGAVDLWQLLDTSPESQAAEDLWGSLGRRLHLIKARPKLREDLVISRSDGEDGRSYYVVKDPESLEYYRFKENEYFVLSLLDGNHDVRAIVRAYYDEFKRTIRPQTVQAFFELLDDHALLRHDRSLYSGRLRGLEDNRLISQIATPLLKRLGAWLSFEWTLPNTDASLQRLYSRMDLLFTRPMVVMLTLLSVVGLSAVALEWRTAWSDVRSLLAGGGWLPGIFLFYLTMAVVIVVHELAHALTCIHFGGHVSKLGVMLYYLTPAAFADTSDAWLFPSKWQRIAVSFAGPFSNLVLAGLGGLLWRWRPPGRIWQAIGPTLLLSTLPSTLTNLNPFMEHDGYYILSDYTGITNLRKKAFTYCRRRLRGLWRADDPQSTPPRRERRIFLIYGIVSTLYFILVVLIPLTAQLPWLIRRCGPVIGGSLIIVLILLLFHRQIRSCYQRWKGERG